MEKNDFEIFKKNVLIPYLNELKDLDSLNCLKVKFNRLDRIYWYYQQLRDMIKKGYMQKDTGALDRHKVGAALIYGVLCANVIRIKKSVPNLSPHLLMANEYFAVNVALNVVEMFKRTTDNECEDYQLSIPVSYHNTEGVNSPFLYELCLGLYEQNIKKCFNPFAYSIILFQLEDKTDYMLKHPSKDVDTCQNPNS